ncbi:histone deacetylase complex subunit SAP18, partial [Phenoliferia sp. Uapishka_3]
MNTNSISGAPSPLSSQPGASTNSPLPTLQRRDSTLRELLLLLRDATPSLRTNPLARYSIRLVYFDTTRDRYQSRELAMVQARDIVLPPLKDGGRDGDRGGRDGRGAGMDRTLDEARFVIGDYVDVAYHSGPMGMGIMGGASSGGGGGGGGGLG